MYGMYNYGVYGVCPRCVDVYCLPFGMSNLPGQSCTAIYCGSCKEVYRPAFAEIAQVDGAYFGSTFCHLFFLQQTAPVEPLRDPSQIEPSARANRMKLDDDDRSDEDEKMSVHPAMSRSFADRPPYYIPRIFGYKVSSSIRDRRIREAAAQNRSVSSSQADLVA